MIKFLAFGRTLTGSRTNCKPRANNGILGVVGKPMGVRFPAPFGTRLETREIPGSEGA
jgi:hypothetical protein